MQDKVVVEHPTLGDVTVYTVYEKIGRVCRFCALLGHEMGNCSDRIALIRIKNAPENQGREELKDILNPTLGPWILTPTMIPKIMAKKKSMLKRKCLAGLMKQASAINRAEKDHWKP